MLAGTNITSIIKWDGKQWAKVADGPDDGFVIAMAKSARFLYVGGRFSRIGGIPANNIAQWDGQRWLGLGEGISSEGGESGQVNALAARAGDLFAGGLFTRAGTAAANGIACWDGRTWASLGNGVSKIGLKPSDGGIGVWSLLDHGTNLYVGGHFAQPGKHIVKWNGQSWEQLGAGPYDGVGTGLLQLFGWVTDFASIGANIYNGGLFSHAGGIRTTNLARWDGSAWHSMDSRLGGFDAIRTVTAVGTALYVGGEFTRIGNVEANRVARWDGRSRFPGLPQIQTWCWKQRRISMVHGGSV
ncbi:MAG: hypothetical protein FJ403_13105 [Verrucomicrobia bacterium]|nr:hypothetical protein [Verrucomicrobiota bacterium]